MADEETCLKCGHSRHSGRTCGIDVSAEGKSAWERLRQEHPELEHLLREALSSAVPAAQWVAPATFICACING